MSSRFELSLKEFLDEISATAAALRKSMAGSTHSTGVSLAAGAVLHRLRQQPGLTVPQLARQRGTSRQSMQVLVDRLLAAGQMRSVPNPDHRRSDRLQLTPAGRQSLNSSNQHQATILGKVSPQVTEQELEGCILVLQRVREHLGGRNPASLLRRKTTRGSRAAQPPLAEPPTEPGPGPIEESAVDSSPPQEFPINLL